MRRTSSYLAGVFSLALAAGPVAALDEEGQMREGLDLLGEGTRLLLRGLMSEMEPALRGLVESLEGLDAYHPPEVLPNGDIIIRRKRPEPSLPEGEIEL